MPCTRFFFYIYVWCVTFAIVRVISAIFLKETLAAAAEDQETAMMEHMRKKEKEISHLRRVFNEADQNGDGRITWDEFVLLLNNEEVKNWLSHLGFDVVEISGLFKLLDGGDGEIEFDELLSGVMRIKGGAKHVDLLTLLYENQKLHHRLHEVKVQLNRVMRHVGVASAG